MNLNSLAVAHESQSNAGYSDRWIDGYPCRLCRSAWVLGCLSPSVCLSVCLSGLVVWFWGLKIRGSVRLGLTAIRRRFKLWVHSGLSCGTGNDSRIGVTTVFNFDSRDDTLYICMRVIYCQVCD